MSCSWRPPLETASDCPGQEALDKASYVGLYSPCRAGALAPRQFPKNHTAGPRHGPFWADTHAVRGIFLRELIGESGRSSACFLEGCLYVCNSKSDLAKRFDRCWMTSQCT